MLQANAFQNHPLVRKVLAHKWMWLLFIVIVGCLIGFLIHNKSSTKPYGFGGFGGRNNTTVGFAAAEVENIPIELNALGTVTATATAIVRPQVSGVLQHINFREGQMVTAGQVLATIDPRPFELALMQASGQRQRDEAQLDNAKIILARDKILQSQDSIAQQDVEAQAALVKQLEGTLTSDQAQEGTARLNLSYTKVTAPVSGRVGLRMADIGNLINSGDANGIAVITQVAPIDVEFSIPQNQVADMQATLIASDTSAKNTANPATNSAVNSAANNAVKVLVLDRDRINTLATGDFLALDNQMDIQTGTVKAKARFANEKQQLFPNEFVNIKVILRQIAGAIVIPVSALRHSSDGDFVYILNEEDDTVSKRVVTVGQATVEKVQVTTGLKAGEKVITEGADRLKDGVKVNLPSTAEHNHSASHMSNASGADEPNEKWKNKAWKRGGEHSGKGSHEWPKKPAEGSSDSSAPNDGTAPSEHKRKRPTDES